MSQASDNYDQIAQAVREVLSEGAGLRSVAQPGLFSGPIFPLSMPMGVGGASFSGKVFVKGALVDLTSTTQKAWIKVTLGPGPGSAVYDDGPPTIPFPPWELWFETAQSFGNIVVP